MNYDQIISQRIQNIKPSGIRKFFDILEEMTDAISLGIGEPDFVTPWHIRDAGIYSLERGHTKYTSNAGMLQLRREIAAYLNRRFDLHYDYNGQILVTVGGSEAIDLAMRVWDRPGFDAVNVSSNQNYSVRELYAIACELMGKQIEAKYCPTSHYWAKYPELYGGAYGIKPEILDHEVNKYSLCDNAHARERYGWQPRVDIREGLRRVVQAECAMLAARDGKGE